MNTNSETLSSKISGIKDPLLFDQFLGYQEGSKYRKESNVQSEQMLGCKRETTSGLSTENCIQPIF